MNLQRLVGVTVTGSLCFWMRVYTMSWGVTWLQPAVPLQLSSARAQSSSRSFRPASGTCCPAARTTCQSEDRVCPSVAALCRKVALRAASAWVAWASGDWMTSCAWRRDWLAQLNCFDWMKSMHRPICNKLRREQYDAIHDAQNEHYSCLFTECIADAEVVVTSPKPLTTARMLCSCPNLSRFLHLARLFWNQTCRNKAQ